MSNVSEARKAFEAADRVADETLEAVNRANRTHDFARVARDLARQSWRSCVRETATEGDTL